MPTGCRIQGAESSRVSVLMAEIVKQIYVGNERQCVLQSHIESVMTEDQRRILLASIASLPNTPYDLLRPVHSFISGQQFRGERQNN